MQHRSFSTLTTAGIFAIILLLALFWAGLLKPGTANADEHFNIGDCVPAVKPGVIGKVCERPDHTWVFVKGCFKSGWGLACKRFNPDDTIAELVDIYIATDPTVPSWSDGK